MDAALGASVGRASAWLQPAAGFNRPVGTYGLSWKGLIEIGRRLKPAPPMAELLTQAGKLCALEPPAALLHFLACCMGHAPGRFDGSAHRFLRYVGRFLYFECPANTLSHLRYASACLAAHWTQYRRGDSDNSQCGQERFERMTSLSHVCLGNTQACRGPS